MDAESPSLEQRFELLARIGGKINWNNFSPKDLQILMRDINIIGSRVERIFEGRCREQLSFDNLTNGVVGPFAPTFNPATGTFRWEVNYDETIAQKISVRALMVEVSGYATDENFPDDRKGKRIVTGRIKHWRETGGILGRPKELLDFNRAFPPTMFNGQMPLVAPGQFYPSPNGNDGYLYLDHLDVRRRLGVVWRNPTGEEWRVGWGFLVLDEEQEAV